jgi:hypothetical protein
MKLRTLIVTAVIIFVPGLLGGPSTAVGQDRIKITNITSAQPIVRGVENEISVDIDYALDSADEGEISLGFNVEKPNAFRMVESQIIKRGPSVISLKAKVIPVDWGEKGRFTAMVHLSNHPHEAHWRPLASDRKEIPVGQ